MGTLEFNATGEYLQQGQEALTGSNTPEEDGQGVGEVAYCV